MIRFNKRKVALSNSVFLNTLHEAHHWAEQLGVWTGVWGCLLWGSTALKHHPSNSLSIIPSYGLPRTLFHADSR